MRFWFLAVLMGVVGAAGDILINRWATTGSFRWWLIAAPCWLGMMTLLGYTLRANLAQLPIAVSIALLLNILLVLLWSVVVEKTRMSPMQLATVAGAIIVIVMAELGRKP